MAHRAEQGAGKPTLQMARAAIGKAHAAAGKPNAAAAPRIKDVISGIARERARTGNAHKVRQAKPLDDVAVAAIRGNLGKRANASRQAAFDMALASVMADAGLRRSEAAALVWADLRPAPDGDGGLLAIHRSKTDQEGEGALTFVTQAACDDAGRLRRLSGWPTDDAPMFAVRGQQPPPPKPSATESPPRPRRRGLARATPGTRAA